MPTIQQREADVKVAKFSGCHKKKLERKRGGKERREVIK